MSTCKDCLHYELCQALEDNHQANKIKPIQCGLFKERSKFIELPCKVGDTVYLIPTHNRKPYCGVVEDKVQMIGITSRGIHIKGRNNHEFNKMYMLGKSVFLTKEEAEKVIKEQGRL